MAEGDAVDHPPHYNRHPGIECIEIVRHMNFNLGNVMKYIWRSGLKEDVAIQDLEKAAWYLNDEINHRKALEHSGLTQRERYMRDCDYSKK